MVPFQILELAPQTPGRPFCRCSTSPSRESTALQTSPRRRTMENFSKPVFCLPHSEPSSSQSPGQKHTPLPPTPPFRRRIPSAGPPPALMTPTPPPPHTRPPPGLPRAGLTVPSAPGGGTPPGPASLPGEQEAGLTRSPPRNPGSRGPCSPTGRSHPGPAARSA